MANKKNYRRRKNKTPKMDPDELRVERSYWIGVGASYAWNDGDLEHTNSSFKKGHKDGSAKRLGFKIMGAEK